MKNIKWRDQCVKQLKKFLLSNGNNVPLELIIMNNVMFSPALITDIVNYDNCFSIDSCLKVSYLNSPQIKDFKPYSCGVLKSM